MDMIGRYQKITELNNDNAGTCMWCYAVRGGQEYFIKKFPEPKYPTTDSEASPKLVAKKLARCEKFEQKKLKMYRAVNEASDGNVVRIADFFRVGAQYYMAMPRVKSIDMGLEEISKLPEHVKRRICTVIAHAVAQLHSVQFVHFDIKHENIMFTHSRAHKLTAKLIDYDEGFFEDNPPTCSDEVGGSWPYFSPEAWILMDGGSARLSSKLDVFALGILFHQYYTGKLPEYDENRFRSAGDAVRAGEKIDISRNMPEDIRRLISRMLVADPDIRPSAQAVFNGLTKSLELMYKVCHEVDGTLRDEFFYKQAAGSYDGNKITVKSGSLTPRTYDGYKFAMLKPWIVEGETVNDGTIITLTYIKDTTQQKTASYTVLHKVEGEIVEQIVYSKRIWINAPNELPIESESLLPRLYAGCEFDTVDTSKHDGDFVASGTVITLHYKKTTPVSTIVVDGQFTGDAPARSGFWDMGDL